MHHGTRMEIDFGRFFLLTLAKALSNSIFILPIFGLRSNVFPFTTDTVGSVAVIKFVSIVIMCGPRSCCIPPIMHLHGLYPGNRCTSIYRVAYFSGSVMVSNEWTKRITIVLMRTVETFFDH